MSDQLIVYRGDLPKIEVSKDALLMKEAALSAAALIGRVVNAAEQEDAVSAQLELKRVSALFESARLQVTKPLLEAQRSIKSLVDDHREELNKDLIRISRLVGDFQALEIAKQRAAEAAKMAELNSIEREREQQLASANTHEEREAIQAVAMMKVAEANIPVEPPVARSKNQVIRYDWEITVTDIHLLFRSHPQCVKIEPRFSELRILLDSGVTPQGVKAERRIKAGVRL